VLLVHLVLSPLVFSRLTTEAFESNKVALLILTALTLSAVALWRGVAWALSVPLAERRSAVSRFVADLARDPLALGFVLFAASAVVSTVASISPWTSLLGAHESYAGLGTQLSYVVLFFAARALCRGVADAWRLLAAGVVATGVAAAYAVVQFARLDPMSWASISTFEEHARPFATLGHANILAAYLVTTLPVVVVFAARAVAARAHGSLAVLAGVVGLALTAVLLSLSRGAWLALACAGALLAAFAWRTVQRRHLLLAGGVLLGAATCVAVGLAASGRSDLWRSAATRVRHLTDSSDRREVWSTGLKVFRDRPLVGTGPDTFQLAFGTQRSVAFWHREWNVTPVRAHNEIVHTLATQGAFGGAALLVVVVGLVVAAVRAWRGAAPGSRGLIVAACAGALAFCVEGLFNFTMAAVGSFFVVLAGVLSALSGAGAARLTQDRVLGTEYPVSRNRYSGLGARSFAVLLGLTSLAGVLPFALNGAEEPATGLWWLCCGVLTATAAAAAWAVLRALPSPAPAQPAAPWGRPRLAALWAARVAVVVLAGWLAVRWVAEPHAASLACRAAALAQDDGEPCLDHFERAVELAPHQVIYWVKLSAAAQAAARAAGTPEERNRLLQQARGAAEAETRLEPASAQGNANLGSVLTELAAQGQFPADEALAAYDRAVTADPNNSYFLAAAGQAALLLGRPDRARDAFTRALALDPDYARPRAGLGLLALEARRFDEAADLLEAAAEGDWHNDDQVRVDAYQALAVAYLGSGLVGDPARAFIARHQGSALAQCGAKPVQAAERCAALVIRERPQRPEPRLIRARVLELLGRPAEALAEYRKVLTLAPQNGPARNDVRRLEAAGVRD
jgi:O-antigen ligase/tetratricopeptide (TPR) repeat protein